MMAALSRTGRTLVAFDLGQLAWRAAFVAERHAPAALVEPVLARLTAPRLAPVLVDVGRTMRWRRDVPDTALDAMLEGRLELHGCPRAIPGAPLAPAFWLEPPRPHPDARHVMFELWCHGFAPVLAAHARRAQDASGAPAALELLRWLWQSWTRTVTLGTATLGGAWHPWTVARRALHWLEAIDWLQGRALEHAAPPLAADALLPQLWRELERSARYLRLHLERDLRGNHLLNDALALMALGLAFAEEPWFRQGARLFARELPAQLTADGLHHERSPMYHAEVLAMALDAVALSERAARVWGPTDRLRATLEQAVARMLAALEQVTHRDDRIALLGDSAHGVAPDAARLRDRAHALGISPLPAAAESPAAGIVRLTCAHDQVVILDAAPFGPRTLPAHGHADAGTLEYSVGELRLLVDGGTFCYDAGPLRDYFRGSRGHNTLYVPGREQSELWQAFRVARRASVRLERCGRQHAELTVRGYFTPKGVPLTWRRSVHLTRRGLDLLDALDDAPPPGALLLLRLAQGTEVTAHEHDRLELTTAGRTWCIEGAVRAVRSGWYAPRFGALVHVPLLELEPPRPDTPRLTRIRIA